MLDGLHRRGKIWHFCWRGSNGRRQEISTRTADFRQARRVRAERIGELQQGLFPQDERRRLFADAAQRWVEHANLSTRAANTKRFRRSKVSILVKFFGAMRLREITPARIFHFQTQRARIASNATVNAEFWMLRAILRRFGAWMHAHAEICRPLRVRQELKRHALTNQEIRDLLYAAQMNPRWRPLREIVLLALHTGMRSAEIRGIRLGDLKLEIQPRPRIAIQRRSTKTEVGERLVALDGAALDAVRELIEIARRRGSKASTDYLFPAGIAHGAGWDPKHPRTSWGSVWPSLRRAAGLAGIRFHDLRHTYITTAAEAGVPLDVIMRQVGHIDPAMTRIYIQIRDEALDEAVGQIEKRFENGNTPL
jgi:integrase